MENLAEYMETSRLIDWAKASLNIIKLNSDMTDEDIRRVIRRIGMCAVDTVFVDGDKPILRRIGIGMMLSLTLLEFPEFYSRYELAQFN
ncbi:unnamed protein product [marine sediment metagenome]|uniref:Uncharacterized protein n=1 Tax=marine sediment metagenome TaxID=412755 RepID=X0UKU1_9ZZZZ